MLLILLLETSGREGGREGRRRDRGRVGGRKEEREGRKIVIHNMGYIDVFPRNVAKLCELKSCGSCMHVLVLPFYALESLITLFVEGYLRRSVYSRNDVYSNAHYCCCSAVV